MNKRVRGFILVTLALSLGFCLTAQSPTFPLIQGRVLSTGRIVPVQVDANGVVQVNGGGGGGGCSAPCVVIGPDAPGAAPTQDPVQAAGFDGTDVRRILTDSSGRTVVTPQAAVGAAAGNPFPTGYRDDSGNVQANYGFPDQATVTVSATTGAVLVSGVRSAKENIHWHLGVLARFGAIGDDRSRHDGIYTLRYRNGHNHWASSSHHHGCARSQHTRPVSHHS